MSKIQTAIQKGLSSLRKLEIQKMATYKQISAATYNTTTGAVGGAATEITVPLIMSKYNQREIDGQVILAEDQKALIAVKDLSIIPSVNDSIVLADGTVWNIVNKETDPSNSVWVLQVRRP